MTNSKKAAPAKPAKKMPVAGKSGKDGVTADLHPSSKSVSAARAPRFRIKDQPVISVPGQFQPH